MAKSKALIHDGVVRQYSRKKRLLNLTMTTLIDNLIEELSALKHLGHGRGSPGGNHQVTLGHRCSEGHVLGKKLQAK